MKKIIYNFKEFEFYKSAKYDGISILTHNKWHPGESIYWYKANNKVDSCGFTYNEAIKFNLITNADNSIDEDNFHKGSTDSNITYDDSYSRNLTKKLFLKEFNIELHDHPNLYILETLNDCNIYMKYKDGQYCEDLIGYNKDLNKKILVEVERSQKSNLFNSADTSPITILVSKYWKYFHDGNPSNIHYMCFIHEELNKACIVSGSDIMNCEKRYKALPMPTDKIKEIYEIPKSLGKIYDLN